LIPEINRDVLGAMAVAMSVLSDVVKVPINWRIATVTATSAMLPAHTSNSTHAGMEAALRRCGGAMGEPLKAAKRSL
jgi:hypothetical protein